MGDKVKVAVRVRPLNKREIDLGAETIVEMNGQQTTLHPQATSNTGKAPKKFTYDHCFWSCNRTDKNYSDQCSVFNSLGTSVLDNAFDGYNACIFAYGQTGSGKSYTMMGGQQDADGLGVIPRLCNQMFDRIREAENEESSFTVEVSYMEIYNEKVRDLLDPNKSKQNLRVREHNILGPYVDGLCTLAVSSYEQVSSLMEEGNKARTVAATNMNSESSRSHAVFGITLTQIMRDLQSDTSGEKVSHVSLVDLAGSERVTKSGAVGKRLEEGANINKSLTTLGMVISALAEQSSHSRHSKSGAKFVPYRDSVLTWLLKDNLGGNSRTVMIATISPAADNYEETLSTLRYADRAKRIENHAVVNEDPNARIIRELRAEVEALRAQIKQQNQTSDVSERLAESEKLMSDLSRTWEERLKETQRMHEERHKALQQMGISVQGAGIKVEHGKFYLVNLNADPALNELLVYHLNEENMVGSASDSHIQLRGLGVQPHHALLVIEDNRLYIQSMQDAKTFVNGKVIGVRTCLRNGHRVLIGNNHYFRVNCPREAGLDESLIVDYADAVHEVVATEMGGDNAITTALNLMEQQRASSGNRGEQQQLYERQMSLLRRATSPATPFSDPFGNDTSNLMTPASAPRSAFPTTTVQQQRDDMLKKSVAKLREHVLRANQLTREASLIASELQANTTYSVTLQIPAANLTPLKIKKGAFVSEPAVLVRRKHKGSQVWSVEKLEYKLVDMREIYMEMSNSTPENFSLANYGDPFFDSQENHILIGVANVFLEVLFHDVRLNYHVPIISQQGEVSGRLHVEVWREHEPEMEGDASVSESTESVFDSGRTITARIRVKQATNLPSSLSNFVFCQYSFFNQPEPIVVPPVLSDGSGIDMAQFDHEQDYTVTVTEEFLEYCQEDALSIQVWGHRTVVDSSLDNDAARKNKSLEDRWAEVTRRLSVNVELRELTDQGVYAPVEVLKVPDVPTGGVYQLKQGQQRRIVCGVQMQPHGQLPLVPTQIVSVAIGSINLRNRSLQRPLDTYQESDLEIIREKWSEALQERRIYLDDQIQRLMKKPDKSEEDVEREQSLIAQWVALTEERNAVYIPSANSNIPGAPADWQPPPGMEEHVPVLYLSIDPDQMSGSVASDSWSAAGNNSVLPKENANKMFGLPILKHDDEGLTAEASWDSSIHEHAALLRVTESTERVYAILKITVRMSHPTDMDVVLRKRLCFNVYKRASLTGRIMKHIIGSDNLVNTGVFYDLVAHIPKSSLDAEDRNSLALMAGRGEDSGAVTAEGESYMERYTRGISAVESILALDRLRQEVAIKEMLSVRNNERQATGKLKRAVSMPNTADKPVSGSLRRSIGTPGTPSLLTAVSPASLTRLTTPRRPMAVLSEEVHKQHSSRHHDTKPRTSRTVPDQLMVSAGSQLNDNNREHNSLGSSGYGSQVFTRYEEEASDSLSTIAESANNMNNNHDVPNEHNQRLSVARVTQLQDSNGNAMLTSTYSDYDARLMSHGELKSSSDSLDAKTHSTSDSVDSNCSVSLPSWLQPHAVVRRRNDEEQCFVRYIGQMEGDSGLWVGVELTQPNGLLNKNQRWIMSRHPIFHVQTKNGIICARE